MTYISVLELAADASGRTPQFREVTTTTPIVSWPTDSGSTLWVTSFVAPITAEQAREVDRLRAELTKQTAGMNLNDQAPEPRSHLRSFGIFEPPDGIGRIVDIDAEFLRSRASDDDRRRRIEECAYFLWQNRTGQRWWDAVSNWCEAESSERPDRAT